LTIVAANVTGRVEAGDSFDEAGAESRSGAGCRSQADPMTRAAKTAPASKTSESSRLNTAADDMNAKELLQAESEIENS
jgi:hypothetical protein